MNRKIIMLSPLLLVKETHHVRSGRLHGIHLYIGQLAVLTMLLAWCTTRKPGHHLSGFSLSDTALVERLLCPLELAFRRQVYIQNIFYHDSKVLLSECLMMLLLQVVGDP
jgi:hypothetical protein